MLNALYSDSRGTPVTHCCVSELDEFLGDLEEDVEGMQTMIYVLQSQLRDAKEAISQLEDENARLRAGESVGRTARENAREGVDKARTLPKKLDPDKIEVGGAYKMEQDGQNGQGESYGEGEMEGMVYENERTDSDFDAEYNYEGIYENDDRYQEELEKQERQQAAERDGAGESGVEEEEAMDVDETRTDSRDGDAGSTATPSSKSSKTNRSNGLQCSSGGSVQEAASRQSLGQHSEHKAAPALDARVAGADRDSTKDYSPDSNHHRQSKQHTEIKQTSDDRSSLRIPSPLPNKISPTGKTEAANVRTTTGSSSSNEKQQTDQATTNGSPSDSAKSSHRRVTSPNPLTASRRDLASGGGDGSLLTNQTKDLSPDSAGPIKDKDASSQNFVNGVTSTVNDIEDI